MKTLKTSLYKLVTFCLVLFSVFTFGEMEPVQGWNTEPSPAVLSSLNNSSSPKSEGKGDSQDKSTDQRTQAGEQFSQAKKKTIQFDPDPQNPFPACQKAIQDNHLYKEVLTVLRPWTLRQDNQSKDLPQAIRLVYQCYDELDKRAEAEAWLDQLTKIHADNWLVIQTAAPFYLDNCYGSVISGKFVRGNYDGVEVSSFHHDWVHALILMKNAADHLEKKLRATEKNGSPDELEKLKYEAEDFYANFSGLFHHRSYAELQILADLNKLPDYEKESDDDFYFDRSEELPVDRKGSLIFYDLPKSFDQAKNDGERQRFLIHQTGNRFSQQQRMSLVRARQLRKVFGIHVIEDYSSCLRQMADDQEAIRSDTSKSGSKTGADPSSEIWDLAKLNLDEALVPVNGKIRRVKLPPDHNFINLLCKAWVPSPIAQDDTGTELLEEYQNRRQYAEAAELCQMMTSLYKPRGSIPTPELQLYGKWNARLEQIVGNWGEFEPFQSISAGTSPSLGYRFRNGTSVHLTVKKIDVSPLLDDIRKYLEEYQEKKESIDPEEIDLDRIGIRLLEKDEKMLRYLGPTIRQWTVDLTPAGDHSDRLVPLPLPMKEGGAYLVEAKMNNGNSDAVVVWINDLAIVRKEFEKTQYFYVAEAGSGAPLAGADLKITAFSNIRTNNNGNYGANSSENDSGKNKSGSDSPSFPKVKNWFVKTGKNGEYILRQPDGNLTFRNWHWFITVKDRKDGRERCACLGFPQFWFNTNNRGNRLHSRAFFISDRPVYQPDQEIHFKFWVAQPK